VEGEDDSNKGSCFRNLFVVKPTILPSSSPIKDKVDCVVQLLENVVLEPKKGDALSEPQENVGMEGSVGSKSTLTMVSVDGEGTCSTVQLLSSGESGRLGKKWKRVKRYVPEVPDNPNQCVQTVGCMKRPLESDTMLFSSDSQNDVTKKRMILMTADDEDKADDVAGPTERALGCQ
jgi:hypothetical protein